MAPCFFFSKVWTGWDRDSVKDVLLLHNDVLLLHNVFGGIYANVIDGIFQFGRGADHCDTITAFSKLVGS
ncbi:hypothetical protein CsSME_00038282 [Camellia sinensis var. sinensis]